MVYNSWKICSALVAASQVAAPPPRPQWLIEFVASGITATPHNRSVNSPRFDICAQAHQLRAQETNSTYDSLSSFHLKKHLCHNYTLVMTNFANMIRTFIVSTR
jgi:hypothetical protein